MSLTRRDFLIGSAALAAGASVTTPFFLPKYHLDRCSKRSRVAVLRAEQYCPQLDQILGEGLRLFPINVCGKTVVLKPNLVDYLPGHAINTHPMLVLAAAESFRGLGAKSVVVAEGPGHQRDTQLVLSQSGYQEPLREEKIRFVDLNRDELERARLPVPEILKEFRRLNPDPRKLAAEDAAEEEQMMDAEDAGIPVFDAEGKPVPTAEEIMDEAGLCLTSSGDREFGCQTST